MPRDSLARASPVSPLSLCWPGRPSLCCLAVVQQLLSKVFLPCQAGLFFILWLERAGIFVLFCFVLMSAPFGISGLLASLAPSLRYMRQKKKKRQGPYHAVAQVSRPQPVCPLPIFRSSHVRFIYNVSGFCCTQRNRGKCTYSIFPAAQVLYFSFNIQEVQTYCLWFLLLILWLKCQVLGQVLKIMNEFPLEVKM